ncbi:serine hydrolase domain-containing protein [Stenotrophomonas sp.]|uniref:serine hydrolase domain-containing protein n=1 Tax=Stenotrophomonas sp. TaxID=69392 RepID=UPI002FC5897F
MPTPPRPHAGHRCLALAWAAVLALVPGQGAAASGAGKDAAIFAPMLDQAVAYEKLPGIAMAVVADGEVVFTATRGERRAGTRQAIDADTLFKIASNSKAMTAALLARLVDQGRLRWEDRVIDYLPQFRMYDPWVTEHLQVRDLLIHNSGLGLGAGDLMLWPEPNAYTRQDVIAGLAHLKPVTSFRSGYAYDNLMYVVAGEVAAAAGGKPYDQLLRQEVFAPLGMQRCQVGAWSVTAVGNVAQPHARYVDHNAVLGADADMTTDHPSMAAGGIRCSLADMTRWMQVLLDPSLAPGWLSQAQRRALWTAHMPMPIGARQREWDNAHFSAYGYGWRLSDMDGQWKVAHTGTLSGMYSSLALLPDRRVGVVVLINGDAEDARTALTQAALKHYTAPADPRGVLDYLAALDAERQQRKANGQVRPDTRARRPVDLAATRSWHGRYADPWLGEASVCPRGGQLELSIAKSPLLHGQVMQVGERWLVDWETRGADAEPWLAVQPGPPTTLTLRAIDPEIDFSYDYQDLLFTRIGDCP